MVFYLKDAQVIIKCNHAALCKFIYSVTKNDKVNNWSQEIYAIPSYINFQHIKGKENMLVDSLSRLKCLGLHEGNGLEKLGYEYGKFIFDTDKDRVCNDDIRQNVDKEFEIEDIKYYLD